MLGLGTWKDSADYYGSYAVTHGRYGITNLSVHNTYSGGTYLNGGTLILNSASALGIVSGNNITVADGGILTSGGADIDVVTVPHDMDEAFVAEVRSKLGISDRPLFINGRWSYGTPAVMYDSNREIQFDAEAGDRLPYVGMLGIVSGSVLDGTVDIGPDLAAYEYQADPFSWRRKSGFVKDGPGLLVLTGRNTYAGTTTISGGVLRSRTAPGAFLDDIQVDFLLEEQLREKSATTSGWMWQDRWVHGPLRQYLPQVCEAAPYVTLASGLGNVAGVLAFVPPAAQQYRPAGMAARRSAVSADTWPRLRPMVDKLLSEPLPATRGAALNTLHVQRVVQNVGDVLGRVQQELAGGQSAWPFMPVLQPLLQQPVKYRMDDAKFRDLLQYAPGLNTSVEDVEALLEAEVQYGVRPAVGKIDPRAELLIERCRKAPWQSIITAGPDGGSILTFDGAGRYVSQGPTPQGLAETVICDGNTIVHMYGELGLASQRVDSRFHRRAFIERVPWLVPPAGDLSVGANVTLAADDTIAVEPLAGGVAEQLVFAPGGNLAERRLVKAGKVLARQTYSPDGAIVTYDANGVATAASRPTLPAVEPNLKPDLAATVVLPLPIRDVRYHQIYSRSGVGSYPDRRSDEQLLAYAWSCLGEHNGDAATILGGFIARGDRRLGLYVLLLAAQGRCGGANGVLHLPKHQFRLEVAADHPHSPAAAYVQAMMLPAGANANLPQAVAAVGLLHDLALLEQLQRVAAPQAPATRPQDSAKNILAALPKFKTAHVAWVAAALAMQCDPMAETVRQLAAATEKLPAVAGLSPSVRCEMAAALYRAGDSNTAAAMFEGLFREPVAAGRVPMLSAVMASALGEARGGGEVDELVKSAAGEFARSGSPAIVALAAQCEQLGKRDLAASVLRMLAAGDAAPALAATRLRALLAAGQLDEAWQAVQAAGADPELAASPWLWRVGYVAAEGLGRTADATACLDRALDLEYQRLGDSVDVPTVEAQYGELLSHYQDAVREVRGRGAAVSPEQLAMVIRAADRWRALTGNEAAACAAAANVFMMAGQYELAWEYATSPLALRPNDPGPLAGLGRQLRDASLPGLAAHAFASAFGAAPTDPSYLWEQARALEQDGQSAQAIALYRQIANGQWRSQFDSLKSDAREALEKGRRE